MDVCETKNMDLFNKVHVFELIKVHTFVPNICQIRLMLNYAKPRMLMKYFFSVIEVIFLNEILGDYPHHSE